MIRLPAGLRQPMLVSGTDGVGTKLELAQDHHAHHNVGIDLVAMCVNDVITSGAQPLFFLDYMATGALSPEAMAEVVEGIADGCRQSGCSLLGGETAEMPGFYPAGRYDLAGFCVAVVEESELIDGRQVQAGDAVIGVASSGVHSNGFSLVRRVLEHAAADRSTRYGPDQRPLIDDLLGPTQLYAPPVLQLLTSNVAIHAMAHITGGGLPENLPRCLPAGCRAQVNPTGWARPCSIGFNTLVTFQSETSGTPSISELDSVLWCRRIKPTWRLKPVVLNSCRPGHRQHRAGHPEDGVIGSRTSGQLHRTRKNLP